VMPTPKFNQYVKAGDALRLTKAKALDQAVDAQEAFLRAVKCGPVDEAITASKWGVGGQYLADIQDVFRRFGVKGYMRERAPEAIELIDKLGEAVWKPEAMKPKGLSDLDILILDNDIPPIFGVGGKRQLKPKGITAIFMPDEDDVIKARLLAKGEPNHVINACLRRAQQRREEFEKYVPEFESWARPVSEGGGMPIAKNYKDNGIPNPSTELGLKNRAFRYDRHRRPGKPTIYIPKMMTADGKAFKYISGDVDWIHFTFLDGLPLDALTAERLYDAMSRACGFQHGETITWLKEGQTVFKGKISQLAEYMRGGPGQKALLEVSGDSTRATRIDAKLSRFGKTGREHLINFEGGLKGRGRALAADIENAFAHFQSVLPDRRVLLPYIRANPEGEDGNAGRSVQAGVPMDWSYTSANEALLVRPKDATHAEVFNGQTWVETLKSQLPNPLPLTPATELTASVAAGATRLPLVNLPDMYPELMDGHLKNWFAAGQTVIIAPGGPYQETAEVLSYGPMVLKTALQFAHPEGTMVAAVAGTGPGTGADATEKIQPIVKLGGKGKVTNGYFQIVGTATDNVNVARVEVRVNGGEPTLMALDDLLKGGRGFIASLSLENGRNTIEVTAYDFSGNASNPSVSTVIYTKNQSELAGIYSGVLMSTGPHARDRTGFLRVTVTKAGLFSGKVSIGDHVQAVTGLFDNEGIARFKPMVDTVFAATSAVLTKKVKNQTRELGSLKMMLAPGVISGTVDFAGEVLASVDAPRAFFDGKTVATTVNAYYLDNKGKYTAILPARETQAGLSASEFPQGVSYGTTTVSAKGAVRFAGKLADGTAITASAALSEQYQWPFFVPLYKGLGVVAGHATLDGVDVSSDMRGPDFVWIRPATPGAPYYAEGWPSGIALDFFAAKYAAVPGALPGLFTENLVEGNATLEFSGGKLATPVLKTVNISPKFKVTNSPKDGSFSLSLVSSSGLISGSFTDGNGTKPKWNGVIYQKGSAGGGYGYFLSIEAAGDAGESGMVTLYAK
jgi:hypothetical protein